MNQSDGHELVDHRFNETRGRRIRFFIDPSLSDEEIAERIIEMADEHFDISDEAPSDE